MCLIFSCLRSDKITPTAQHSAEGLKIPYSSRMCEVVMNIYSSLCHFFMVTVLKHTPCGTANEAGSSGGPGP